MKMAKSRPIHRSNSSNGNTKTSVRKPAKSTDNKESKDFGKFKDEHFKFRLAEKKSKKTTKPSSVEASKLKGNVKKYDPLLGNQELRLNKFIADAGICSRRKADELIKEGKVKVNSVVVTDLSTKVHKADFVTVNGDPITFYKNLTYILLNKPKNCITTSSDEKGRKTIFDIVKKEVRLFSVGRLDRNTTGALLITNDGELANRLTHPRYEIPREYNVTLDKPISQADVNKVASGVELEDGMSGECNLFVFPEDKKKLKLEIFEGRNREVRRIFKHLGYEVVKLDRKMFAGISAKGLNRGEYRHLDKYEIAALKKFVKLK